MLESDEKQTIMDNLAQLSDEEILSYLVSYAKNAGDFDHVWEMLCLIRKEVLGRMKLGK